MFSCRAIGDLGEFFKVGEIRSPEIGYGEDDVRSSEGRDERVWIIDIACYKLNAE